MTLGHLVRDAAEAISLGEQNGYQLVMSVMDKERVALKICQFQYTLIQYMPHQALRVSLVK